MRVQGFGAVAFAASFVLGGCASTSGPSPSLASAMDCLRTGSTAVISAHRAGPRPGVPENSLGAIAGSIAAGIEVLEVDIALSADGTPVLMHDRTLDRTSTGRGPVGGLRLADLKALRLRDASGSLTEETIPTLAEALALTNGRALLMLDIKSGVTDSDPARAARHRTVVQAAWRVVRQAGAQASTALISYAPEETAAMVAVAPAALQSVSVTDAAGLGAYQATGLRPAQMLAFTGTRSPNRAAWQGLSGAGVEVIFGTLGAPGRRLDDVYASDRNLSEYRDLVRDGVQIIATDSPLAVRSALTGQQRATAAACLAPAGILVKPD